MESIRFLGAIILSCVVSVSVFAQENRYMVFFKDKTGVPYEVSSPIEFLSQKAIDRRLKQSIDITELDLPVNPAHVAGVRNAGASAFFTTRWMNGVLVHCDAGVVPALEALQFVDRVELVAPGPEPSGGRRSANLRKKSHHIGIETESQLRMIGVDKMQEADYKGQGVTIAVLDSGFPGVNVFPAFEHLFTGHKFNESLSYDFVHHSSDVFHYDDHGTMVLSVIAANIPDAFTGGAYEANVQLYITEDVPTEYRIEEYNWLFAAERADSAGVDIISSSLGYYDFDDPGMNYSVEQMDGKTAVVTRAAQWAADRGILVIVSAGNEGTIANWRIITAPADAKDVLAIGGVNSALQKNPSSSIGPTADNRIKPDLAALGVAVKVVNGNGQITTASGTSLSTPLVSSLAAGVLQRYPDLTSKEVLDLLRKTASQASNPDNLLGYGIPNFAGVVNYQENVPQTEVFEVFPNPLIDDTLTISPLDPEVVESWDIQIISAQGQILAKNTTSFNWLNRTYRADMSRMASGIYYIRVFSEQKRYTFKVVKL
jgi:subtilisin family serine protease